MPIEIRELVVKATIDPKQGGAEAGSEKAPKGKEKEKKRLVAQAADQVFDLLRHRNER